MLKFEKLTIHCVWAYKEQLIQISQTRDRRKTNGREFMTVSNTTQQTVFLYGTNESPNDVKNTAIDQYLRTPLLNSRHDALQLLPNMVEVLMVTSVVRLQHCWSIDCAANPRNRNCSPMDAYLIVCCYWTCWKVRAVIHYLGESWHCDSPSMKDSHRMLIQDW